jgi:hypothetical protein
MPTPDLETDPNARLSVWAEFASPETEARYRLSGRVEENWIALVLVIAGLLRLVALIPSDRELLGDSPAFWSLIWGRAGFAALSLGLLFALAWNLRSGGGASRVRMPVMDQLVFVWCLLGAIAQVVAGAARGPVLFLGYANTGLVAILLWYFVVPLPFRFQMALAFVTTSGDLYLLTRDPDLHYLIRRSLLASLVLVNGVAATAAWIFHRLKRRAFTALRREEELRIGLESALAEVKTLRGILPICSHCKRVRNDAGSWQQVEEYVHEHTDAEFSHGVCPECIQTYYSKGPKRRKTD